jgi:Arc/MetJ-type ribon-helix-helix transcriptional regulator
MAYQFPDDIDQLVREHMASDNYPSVDDLLRVALLSLDDDVFRDDVGAVQEALAELQAGDPGVELHEAFRAIRERYGMDPQA